MRPVDRALSCGTKQETLPKAIGRIRANRDRLVEHSGWRLSQVEIDMMILCGVVDGLLDGSVRAEEVRASDRFVCPQCKAERPRNGFACWNCGEK